MKNFFKPTIVTWVVVIFIIFNQLSISVLPAILPINEIASWGAFYKNLLLFNLMISLNLSFPFFWFNEAFVYPQQNLFVHAFMLILSPVIWVSLLYTLASFVSWFWINLSLLAHKKF